MPHINRIRVNNVKYNFGTQFYDDFVMRFDGKNALYDLANGGGKSVLMLLLFQNLIPNCTLDDKQPIEKLFRTSQGSTTIHSLVEWRLDESDIREGYKYLLTGFCARKAKEDPQEGERVKDAAAIEYFNYTVLYREYNENDIINLPLQNEQERITYTGLKTYLRELGKKDYGLSVRVFDRKGEYQRFISHYGLYESQWEILRGINKTEGHVRTYFESNYKTTRKVVEDLLIEEIIQNSFQSAVDSADEESMAKTLVQIKDQLLELSRRKTEISGYDHQMDVLESFAVRIDTLKNYYGNEEKVKDELIKTYNTASAAHKMKERDLAVSYKEKDFAKKHLTEISRKLDTVKVQEKKALFESLEKDTTVLERKALEKEQAYTEKQARLNLTESMNDYGDYLENLEKRDSIRAAISHSSGGEDLLEALHGLASLKYGEIKEKRERLNQSLNQSRDAYEEQKNTLELLKNQERQYDLDLAVERSALASGKKEEKRLLQNLEQARKNVNVLLVENIDQTIRKHEAAMSAAKEDLENNSQRIQNHEDRVRKNDMELDRIKGDVSVLHDKIAVLKDFFKRYEVQKERAGKLLSIYGSSDYGLLKEEIRKRYKNCIISEQETKNEIRDLEKYLDYLNNKTPVVPTKELEAVMEYLRRVHGITCLSGSEYLRETDDQDKEALLENMPFLPYCIIIRDGFTKIEKDVVFHEKNFGNYLIPMVSLESVLSHGEVMDRKRVLMANRDKSYFTDSSKLAVESGKVLKQLEALRKLERRQQDNSQTYFQDLEFLHSFLLTYQQPSVESRKALLEYKALAEENEQTRSHLEEENSRLSGEIKQARENGALLEKRLDALEQEYTDFGKIREISLNLKQIQHTLKEKDDRITMLIEEHGKIQAQMMNKKSFREELRQKQRHLEAELEHLDSLWEDVYKPYYAEGTFESPDLGEASVHSKFLGLKEAYEKEHVDLEDKKALIESYEAAMERCLNAINVRNSDMEKLAELHRKDELIRTEERVLAGYRRELTELSAEIKELRQALDASKEDKNKLFGKVSQAVAVIEEKYGYFKEVSMEETGYEDFLSDYEKSLAIEKEKLEKAETDIEKGIREIRFLEDVKRDLERLIRSLNVPFGRTRESYPLEINLRKKYDEIVEYNDRLVLERQRIREEFDQAKDKTVEMLRLLEAYEMADEIRAHAAAPESKDEALELMDHIRDTVQIIHLEKGRIEKGIGDMERIKDSFENQCLQRCSSVRSALERLPKLSGIVLEGEKIQMIRLRIPYVKEELYKERMAAYIDEIVQNMDRYEDSGERLRYIRVRLSLKKLFSVIVEDMDAVRLSLYKRERIKEQSRYLRYEEAVGSTGQSQGIYIQFLVAIINYISNINGANVDNSRIGKVIFIDNPFGAAKDIYIWEPIFELLKVNHVQLIVPARGATPAISGRFDVNYVLGQKVVDQRQQTVVIDYHSNVQIQEVEYKKIEFEQEVFDFVQ